MTPGLRRGAQPAPSSQEESGKPSRARSPAGSRNQQARPRPGPPRSPAVGGRRADSPGSGALRPAAAPPTVTHRFPARPGFPQTEQEEEQGDWARKATRTLRPVPTGTPETPPSSPRCRRLNSRRTRRRKRGGASAKEELRKGGTWVKKKKKMLLNEKTLFGARTRDKQRRARGHGDLPGTRAGTAEGDESSGIRKRAEAEASRDREVPGTGERKRSRRRWSRGPAVTCSGRLTLCGARSSVRLRSAGVGRAARAAELTAGSGTCGRTLTCRRVA